MNRLYSLLLRSDQSLFLVRRRGGLLLLTLLALVIAATPLRAQDPIASSGQDFYTTLPWLEPGSLTQSFRLNITASRLCNVTVTFTETGFDTTVGLLPGERWDLRIPRDSIVLPASESVSRRTLHITSTAPVTVNATHDAFFVSDAFCVLPSPSLGFDYFAIAHPTDTLRFAGVIAVIATENNTTIRITPTAQTTGSIPGGTYTRTLQRGEVYQILPASPYHTDLTGTRIRSDRPVAVLSGHQGVSIAPLDAYNSIVEQMVPAVDWGMKFHSTPLPGQSTGSYRVFSARAATEVFANGRRIATLGAGESRFFTVAENLRLEASAPVMLLQYTTHFVAGRKEPSSDPSMMIVNPVESYATSFLWGTPDLSDRNYPGDTVGETRVRFDHYVQIVAPNTVTSSVRLDGAPVTFSIPFDDGLYSAAIVKITPGGHRLTASAPINAQLFGYSDYDAYALPAGMRLRDPFRGEPLIARTCLGFVDTSITLTNVGVEQIDISSIGFSPGISGSVISPTFYPYPVPANSAVQLRVRIDLPNYGAQSGRLIVNTTTSGGRPLEIPIEIARDSLAIDIVESSIRFSDARQSALTVDTFVTVVNTGTGPTTISSVGFTGPFSYLSPRLPVTLGVGDTLRLNVRFTPSSTGEFSGRMIVMQPSCGRPDTVSLSGRRLRAAEIVVETGAGGTVICSDPGTLDIPLAIGNPGEEPLRIDSLQLVGIAPGDYRVVDPPNGKSIVPGGTLVVMIRFVPTRVGERPASIRVWNSLSASGYLLTSITSRKDSVALTPSTTELDFGITSGCDEAPVRTLTLVNSGTLPVTLDSARFALDEFRIDGALPSSIAAGGSIVLSIRFAPRGSRARIDTLRLYGSPCDLVAAIVMRGEQRGASIGIGADTVDFGIVPRCTLPLRRSVTLTNTGATPERIVSVTTDRAGYFPLLVDSTLEPGEEVLLEIELSGEGGDAVLTIVAEPCAIRRQIVLRARPVDPTLDPIADIDLGPLASGTPVRGRTTVRNSGELPITIDSIGFAPIVAGLRVIAPTTPFAIVPGESRTVEIEYGAEVAGDLELLAIVYSGAPCLVADTFRIVGRREEDLTIVLKLPDTTASVDDRIEIPITIASSRATTEAVSIEGAIEWNRRVLLVDDIVTSVAGGTIVRIADTTIGEKRLFRFRYSGPIPDRGELAHLRALMLLGTTDTTALQFALLSARSSVPGIRAEVRGEDGGIRTLGICRIGGERFIRLGAAARMEKIFPNPMTGSATVEIVLPAEEHVGVRLVDAIGRTTTIFDGLLPSGKHLLPIERGALSSGLYRVELETRGRTISREMIITR